MRISVALVAVLSCLSVLLVTPGAPSQAAEKSSRHTRWAPVGKATITPGVMMVAGGGQCTANFVFTDRRGGVYVGFAAHCVGKGGATDTDGCSTGSLPLGTKVIFEEGANPLTSGRRLGAGKLASSSWRTMRRLKTKNPATCAYNDFALVKVNAKDVRKVNPSVPNFGGPTGLDRDGLNAGERVYSYGNSSLRGGVSLLSPKYGVTISGSRWSFDVYTITPGIPGDSGSGFLNARGKAVGVLSTVALAPLPLSNGVGSLAKELAFAQQHSGIPGLKLARGTKRFSAP